MSKAATAPTFTGWHFLAWMLGSFLLVMLANFALIYVALTTHSGDVAHGTPPAGMRMMQVSNANAADPGWTLSMTQANGIIHFTSDAADHLELTATLTRPGNFSVHLPLTISALDTGLWRADLTAQEIGQWDLEVVLHNPANGTSAIRHGRVVLP